MTMITAIKSWTSSASKPLLHSALGGFSFACHLLGSGHWLIGLHVRLIGLLVRFDGLGVFLNVGADDVVKAGFWQQT